MIIIIQKHYNKNKDHDQSGKIQTGFRNQISYSRYTLFSSLCLGTLKFQVNLSLRTIKTETLLIYSTAVLFIHQFSAPLLSIKSIEENKNYLIKRKKEKTTNPNQSGNSGPTFVAFGTFLGHGFATGYTQRQMLAITPVQLRRRSTTTTRRLQNQIKRRRIRIHRILQFNG